MTHELVQKSEDIRRYQAEQTVMLNRVRELVRHPGEIVNKAHIYDRLMETTNPSSAQQTLQILVKYSLSMKDLLKEIQKLLPPHGNPRRMLDPDNPGSPPANRYEVAGEVELIPTSQDVAGPCQAVGASRQQESGRVLDCKKTPVPERTRLSPVRRKILRVRRGQGVPNPRYRKRRRLPSRPRPRIAGRPLLRMRCSHQRLTA
jgi:hypothetical protein